MIAFQNINKTFKNKIILKDISFTIEEGQIIKITGSNGCGKSTLLKIACGLIKQQVVKSYMINIKIILVH
ncbi:MAG: ATP-binding cassette domain-containing protein [Erysipelotrichaceae bacterium]|nr:ATP-binding cassette domain-containing protein [Erysipelotrichaceae bacterium]